MSRETKLGFVFVLMVVFGFVVYKKYEQNRAKQGELLAGVQGPASTESTPETAPTPVPEPSQTAQNPIADNALPPAQNPFPEPAPSQPAEFSPASWNEPAPEQQMVSAPPAQNTAPSTSIDDFPAAPAGQDFDPPPQTSAAQPFPPEAQFEVPPPSATTQTQPAPVQSEPVDFGSTPFPAEMTTQASAPQGFEPPVEIANQAEPTPDASMKTGKAAGNPFDVMPAPSEPTPADSENEQFTTQSQTVAQEELPAQPTPAATPTSENPFGNFPAATNTVSIPAQTEISQAETTQTPAPGTESDPFAVSPPPQMPTEAQAFEPVPTTTAPAPPEAAAFPPVGVAAGSELPAAPDSTSFPPIGQSPVEAFPVEAALVEVTQSQSQPLPAETTAPAPMPLANDPRFGDFQPAPAGDQYDPSGVPNELPSEVLTQLTAAEISSGTNGQMLPTDRPEVHLVRPGDNYWNISKKHYGTVRYFTALARYNQQRIPDPKKMRPGMKVLTPSREILEIRNPDLFPQFAGVSNVAHRADAPSGFFMDANGGPMYRVGPNDTLGGIAHKHLGRFSRWVEIYQLNRHRLKDPNALTLGEVLQLPPDASRVSMVRQATGVR